ncbi:MAG TPA: Rrf2 family transcriptional regulator [Acidimicrobiales bacterium]|nr:Rrf2 family transcriptional regulator [Acidimicrobiales bacterium]
MEISAKGDYAVRALAVLAAAGGNSMTVAELASAQGIPAGFLQGILQRLRQRGILSSHRGTDGGYRLARPPAEITVADVLRAVDGPLAAVRGQPTEDIDYPGVAGPLKDVWLALRASMRRVIEHVTLEDIVEGPLPGCVTELNADPAAWTSG